MLTIEPGTFRNVPISIEGVHPAFINNDAYINNPNLTRIINIWGTASEYSIGGMPVDLPPKFSIDNAAFRGPAGLENINIEIKDARHSDFAYNLVDWSGKTSPADLRAKTINQLTNQFMRDLYRAEKDDQTTHGDLQQFLVQNPNVSFDVNRNTWVVDFRVP